MLPLSPVAVCCISLLSLQHQLLAWPAGVRLQTYRSTSEEKQQDLEEDMKAGPVSRGGGASLMWRRDQSHVEAGPVSRGGGASLMWRRDQSHVEAGPVSHGGGASLTWRRGQSYMEAGPVFSHPMPPHTPLEAKWLLWRRLLFQSPPNQESGHPPAPPRTRSLRAAGGTRQHRRRSRRERRHSNSALRGHQHAQLMRVGCVLGTCQVQNLSHRLYQLIGQSGRESSSPINPRSPHSYG
uniref:Adrenomedullin 2 n=1 Tax=Paramormyrops kingsleyae TaxID=1676925 RepID=A0A3B3STM7_9TELE|nr:ADM2 isoform X1 [Paramormyrops kingsleyae]